MRNRTPAAQASVLPTAEELAWAAGFLEGEGCFRGISSVTAKRIEPRAVIDASQKNQEPLMWLLAWFGGRIYYAPKNNIYSWKLTGQPARELMRRLLGLKMSIRRKSQIEIALAQDTSHPIGSPEYLAKRISPEYRAKISIGMQAYHATHPDHPGVKALRAYNAKRLG